MPNCANVDWNCYGMTKLRLRRGLRLRRNHAAKQTVGCGWEKTELAYGPQVQLFVQGELLSYFQQFN
jgi:hypothetical protein